MITFEWAESRFMRRRVDGPREELGAGLVLVVHDRSDLPAEVIQTDGDLEFAIKIPSEVWRECPPHDRLRRNCVVEGNPTISQGRAALLRSVEVSELQREMRLIFEPSSVRLYMSPAGSRMKPSTGLVRLSVSIEPPAPSVTMAIEPSTPAFQP